ncbi:MAG: hypothetical protein Q8N68_02650, partial [bacterium]|nr:hypothetical protein [bacterium]
DKFISWMGAICPCIQLSMIRRFRTKGNFLSSAFVLKFWQLKNRFLDEAILVLQSTNKTEGF